MVSAFSGLLSPIRLGRMQLRNRLVMAPMENMYATPEGLPSPRTIAYFEARAAGGVRLPYPIRLAMKGTARVMTSSTYWF